MIQIVSSAIGQPTIVCMTEEGQRIYLHSRYDPVREADLLIKGWQLPENGTVLVYGLGCGYHLHALLEKLKPTHRLIVFECNQELSDVVMNHGMLSVLLEDSRVELHVLADKKSFINNFLKYLETAEEGRGAFFIHPPSVKIISNEWKEFRELLEEYRIRITTLTIRQEFLRNNVRRVKDTLKTLQNIGKAKGCFIDVPAILVAAGPSLQETIPILSQLKNQVLIICVGTALTPLLQQGVRPDFVVAIEGDPSVIHQFPDLNCGIPLIAFPSASPDLTLQYKGPVIWAFSDGDAELVQLADQQGYPTISSGGSVATAALSILGLFGCNPIVFVGQDLAYINGYSHVTGSMHADNKRITSKYHDLFTEAVGGGTIQTCRSWNIFRRWIERYIREHPEILFFNASHGAHIAGTNERTLKELMEDQVLSGTYDIAERVNQLFYE